MKMHRNPSDAILLVDAMSSNRDSPVVQENNELEKSFFRENMSRETALVQWEYVIVFSNPDYDPTNSSISQSEAEFIYKSTFKDLPISYSQTFHSSFALLPCIESEKAFDGGGKLLKQNEVFTDTGSCKDFLTLIRNMLQYTLETVLQISTQLVLSTDNKYIYLLMHGDEKSLLEEAEMIQYNLQMNISVADLISLEPCDSNLRPFRFIRCGDKAIKDLVEGLKEAGWFIENSEKNFTFDDGGVTAEHWEMYAEYLLLLKYGLEKNEEFGKLCVECKHDVNRRNPGMPQLFSLWDRLNIKKPISPYTDYSARYPTNIWKSHKIDSKSTESTLRNVDKLKLFPTYLSRHISLSCLKEKKIVVDVFCLHNDWELKGSFQSEISVFQQGKAKILDKSLVFYWDNSFFNTSLPLSKIKKYYGEKIGLYFAFVSVYGKYLAFPSIIGIAVFIVQRLYSPNYAVVIVLNAFYSVYMTGVAITLLELWKRKQASLAIEWGQMDFEEDEVPRAQYHGKLKRSPITDELSEIYYPESRTKFFFCIGMIITSGILLLVLSCVSGILILRVNITESLTYNDIDFAGVFCSILNAIQIQIFNLVFSKIVVKLNHLENHKTQSDYDNSLIIKTYIFQFVNSFNSLYYIAFIKSYWVGCIISPDGKKELKIGANCMDELYVQLVSLFVIMFLKNLVEIGVPVLKFRFSSRKVLKSNGNPVVCEKLRLEIDRQRFLPAYDNEENDGTLEDFLELAVMFGYITLFAVAFPLSSFLTYIAILIEIQVDRYKLLHLVRRPQPVGGKDIGVWQGIFAFNCTAAIFTNVAIICFTIPALEYWDLAYQNSYLTYTISVLILLGFQWVLKASIPDIPKSYEILTKRHSNIIDKKLNDKKPDKAKNFSQKTPNFTIFVGYSEQTTLW